MIEREKAERDAEVKDEWRYRNRNEEGVLLRFRLEATDCDLMLHTERGELVYKNGSGFWLLTSGFWPSAFLAQKRRRSGE